MSHLVAVYISIFSALDIIERAGTPEEAMPQVEQNMEKRQ